MTFVRLFCLLACAVALWGASAQAEPPEPYVQISLTPAVSAAAPGEPFDVVIEQKIAAGWHTYWMNPGDSGVPMTASWTLPDGAVAGDLQFPIPSRIPFGPLTNFGYNDRALHAVTLTPPATAKPGDMFTANVQLDWLVCHDICLPEGGAYTVSVPIKDQAEANGDAADIIKDLETALPKRVDWGATYWEANNKFVLSFIPTDEQDASILLKGTTPEFFPVEWGLIDNTDATFIGGTDSGSRQLFMDYKRGDRPVADVPSTDILVAVTDKDGIRHGYITTAKQVADARAASDQAFEFLSKNNISIIDPLAGMEEEALAQDRHAQNNAAQSDKTGLFAVLGLALLGGLILNLMPCVFPVLFIKILAVAKLSGSERAHATRHGLMYALGVVATFVGLAAVFAVLQSAGAQIGWGFQLQSPVVVAVLMVLFIAITLNLAGVFDIDFTRFIPQRLQSIDDRSHFGSFLTGVLAVAVATPCTVPFMGAAVAYGLTNGPIVMVLVFMALGIGLALPFVILTSVPTLMRLLPRPGAWMVTFRRVCAVPMAITAIWLGSVLLIQTGIISATSHTPAKQMVLDYTPATLDQALATDAPVFVNMTAAWCITCKYNEKVAIGTNATQDLFKRLNITYIKGDWTTKNADITHYLETFGHKGVPLYVFYPVPANGTRPAPVVLPQLLTEGIIRDAITQKGENK